MKVILVARVVVGRLIIRQICSVQGRFLFCEMALDMSKETEASILSCCGCHRHKDCSLPQAGSKLGRAGMGDLLHG